MSRIICGQPQCDVGVIRKARRYTSNYIATSSYQCSRSMGSIWKAQDQPWRTEPVTPFYLMQPVLFGEVSLHEHYRQAKLMPIVDAINRIFGTAPSYSPFRVLNTLGIYGKNPSHHDSWAPGTSAHDLAAEVANDRAMLLVPFNKVQ